MNKKEVKLFNIQHLLFLLLMGIMISSCGIFSSADKTTESFSSFYKKFNTDTTYQLNRIDFPINGYHEDLSGREEWTKRNWIYHKAGVQDIDTSKYTTTKQLSSDKYSETIQAKNGSLYFSRTFSLKNGKWYLVKCVNIEE